MQDRLTRLISPVPLPPEELLANIQLTPFVAEYLTVGGRAAREIRAALLRAGVSEDAQVLDFGCGSARTLRHMLSSGWKLHGCDIDDAAIEWAQRALPSIDLRVNDPSPPLPWTDDTFDAAWAASVFTHFDRAQQLEWFEELARVIRPGGVLAVSTMGPSVMDVFGGHGIEENRKELSVEGTLYIARPGSFNDQAAYHTSRGVAAVAEPWFRQEEWLEHGLDGFQDLSVFRRLG